MQKLVAKRMPASEFRAWIKRHGLTITDAAAALGVHRASVRRWAGYGEIGKGSTGAPPHIALATRELDRLLNKETAK